jgi:signal transduction histidine kinase
MNVSLTHDQSARQIYRRADDLRIDQTCPLERESKSESDIQARNAVLLASEFSEFISAASRLETSYRELQKEVSELGCELSERNAALSTSVAENESMRTALQQIVDSMPCGVVVLNCDGVVSIINPESRRLLGLDPVNFRQGSQMTLRQITASSGVDLEASIETAASGDTEQEFCVHDSSGKRWIEVRNRRLFQQSCRGSKPNQTILILRDITAQKRAAQEREDSRKAMALAEITTILAHEIRNPLASLELFAGLIEKDEDRREEWISNLRAGIRSLSGTVNNVLSFHGSGSLKLTPIELPTLIGNAIQFARPLADQASVSLDWAVDHEQVMVMGNECALQQVVLNLVSNAIRHTSAGGSTSVSLRPEPKATGDENLGKQIEQVIVEFSDTGCGIRPDQIDHVFEPGFSGSGDTSGLGLAVCERIMKQHGGRICVSSEIGSGTKFTLHLPVLRLDWATA